MELPQPDSLPEWLIGDSADDRTFVLHLHEPRFILEVMEDDHTELVPVMWIDSQSDYTANELANGRDPAKSMARLMREAGEFYKSELSRE